MSEESKTSVGNRRFIPKRKIESKSGEIGDSLRDINLKLKEGIKVPAREEDFPSYKELLSVIRDSTPAWSGDRMRQGMIAGALLAREYFIVKLGIKENDV